MEGSIVVLRGPLVVLTALSVLVAAVVWIVVGLAVLGDVIRQRKQERARREREPWRQSLDDDDEPWMR